MSSKITFAGFSNGGMKSIDYAYEVAKSDLGVTTNALLIDGGTTINTKVDKIISIIDNGGKIAAVSGKGGLYGDNGEIGPILEKNTTAVNNQLPDGYRVHLECTKLNHSADKVVQYAFRNMDEWFNSL